MGGACFLFLHVSDLGRNVGIVRTKMERLAKAFTEFVSNGNHSRSSVRLTHIYTTSYTRHHAHLRIGRHHADIMILLQTRRTLVKDFEVETKASRGMKCSESHCD